MEKSDDDPLSRAKCQIRQLYSPTVALLCSPDAESVVSKNGLTFSELLQPFLSLPFEGWFWSCRVVCSIANGWDSELALKEGMVLFGMFLGFRFVWSVCQNKIAVLGRCCEPLLTLT